MKLPPRTLLYVDRAFRLPYRLTEMVFNSSTRISAASTSEVLVIKFFGMGSIIRFATLCKEHHVDQRNITLLTFSRHSELCGLLGFKHITIRTSNLFLFIKDCWSTLSLVKAIHPSMIVDYERCSNTVSIYRTFLGWFAKCKTMSFESNRSLESPSRVVFAVDLLSQEQLFLEGIAKMKRIEKGRSLKAIKIDPVKILININASDFLPERKYSIDSFSEVIKTIYQQRSDIQFYLTGSGDERTYVNQLFQKLDRYPVFNMAGKWNLNEFIEQLADCALFITCDSGPLHMAAYLNVLTISLWGPTQAHHFGYYETACFHPLSLHLGCAPCFLHPQSHPAIFCKGRIDCLKNLDPQTVAQKALSLLKDSHHTREINFPMGWPHRSQSKPELQFVR